MDRENKFRGKRTYNGEWICGNLISMKDKWKYGGNGTFSNKWIMEIKEDLDIASFTAALGVCVGGGNPCHQVVPETVGEFTGLKDKNGNPIYEGDVVKWYVNDVAPIGPIIFKDGGFWMDKVWNDWLRGEYEIIGNIHSGETK